MPRFDGTGPRGGGPMTGAGRGWCNPYSAPYARYGPYNSPYTIPAGPGYAYGFGRPRWGAGRGFWSRGSGWEQETEFLRQQAEWLKQQLDAIGQRIEELGKGE